VPSADRYPINLGTALQLAGANNLQIALAEERVHEALARLEGAEVLWVPSINAGVGYNSHTGQIQGTEGEVIEVNRESVFVGGGGVLSGAPLTGASGGPARLAVDISPVDIFFEPLAAQQVVVGSQADEAAVFNDTLLRVTARYLELLDAQSRVAIAEEAVRYADELLRIAEEFSRTGRGLPADAQRARTELADRRRDVLVAEEQLQVLSADLARLLRLRPDVTLLAVDPQPVPLPLFTEDNSLGALIAEGLANRPEVERGDAAVFETLERTRQERLRPWLPNLHLGVSSGGFGGGADDFFGDFSDRTDFDALAVWELRNLGLGNRALIRQRISQHQQAQLTADEIRDLVAAEVTQAYQQVRYRRQQIDEAENQVESAAAALPLNFEGITAGALRVIEAQQAIAALATARSRYSAVVTDYNQAQFALLRAVGRPSEPGASAPDRLPAAN
jgi:outer membrane protein TolC